MPFGAKDGDTRGSRDMMMRTYVRLLVAKATAPANERAQHGVRFGVWARLGAVEQAQYTTHDERTLLNRACAEMP